MSEEIKEKTKEKTINIETIVTIAIAVISLTGAMLGVVHGRYSKQINKAQNKAISAAINREQVNVAAYTWMFQDLRAYAEYNRLIDLDSITGVEAELAQQRGDENRALALREQTQEYRTAAEAKSTFFSSQYILPDGTFDEQSFLDDQIRFGSRNIDINPEINFERAEALIKQASLLRTGIYILSIVVAFLIFAKVSKSKIRYLWIGIAALTLLGDIIYALGKVLAPGS